MSIVPIFEEIPISGDVIGDCFIGTPLRWRYNLKRDGHYLVYLCNKQSYLKVERYRKRYNRLPSLRWLKKNFDLFEFKF